MTTQEMPFYKVLKNMLSLWFGDRFLTRNRGKNIRFWMKDGGNIPVTLQLIFAPDRPIRPNLKSIQKSEEEWKKIISSITHGEGQKTAEKWITYIHVEDFILSVSDVHFSFLAKEVSEQVAYMKDFNLGEEGLTLKNEIYKKDGPITFERAESLMNYEGTPEFIELIQKEMGGQKVEMPLKTNQNEGHKEINAPATIISDPLEEKKEMSVELSKGSDKQKVDISLKIRQNEGYKETNAPIIEEMPLEQEKGIIPDPVQESEGLKKIVPLETDQNKGHEAGNALPITSKSYPHDPDAFKDSLHFEENGNIIQIVSDLEGELHQIEKTTWQDNPNQERFINLLYANMKGKTNSSDVDWQNAEQLLAITPQTSKELQRELWDLVVADLTFRWSEGEKITAREIKALAKKLSITDLGLMYELVELAWVIYYRELLLTEGSFETKFEKVVDFYSHHQPIFSYTDSNKKLFQQYSTAAPIALLAGWYCDADKASSVFEPSAGNGLLTILSDYDKTVVNEIDQTRLANLSYQSFRKVLSMDASQSFPDFHKSFDVVLSNPPFGNLPERNTDFDGYIIKKLDHVMIAHALDTMKDQGKAALIIGGHTHFNEKGMIQSHRTFFNWLYHNYHVADIINIDSRELYRKQGTAFPLRLILINGRKKYPTGFAPQASDEMKSVVASFDELYHRVEGAKAQQFKQEQSPIALASQQLKIILNT